MLFSDDFITIDNERGQAIIGNKDKGSWLRVSVECRDILKEAIEENLTKNEILELFQDKEDRDYFEKLIEKLIEIGVITYFGMKNNSVEEFDSFEVMLTHRCNLNCIHCCVDASASSSPDFFSTTEMIKALQKIIDCNPSNIVLTGGEPMLREDFMILLKYIHDNSDADVTLMTNGTLINDDNVESIAKMVKNVDISIDGVDEESCKAIRGPHVFDKVINAVNLLQQNMVDNISLSMVTSGINIALERDFYALCKNMNVIPLLRKLDYSGRALANKTKLDSIMSVSNADLSYIEPNYDAHRDMISLSVCKAGRTSFSIEANGDIVACSIAKVTDSVIGNIKNISDLREYLRDNGEAISISPDSVCGRCKYNRFCCSCPDLMKKMQEQEDFYEYCEWRKEWIEKVLWENYANERVEC